jgi:hypothetical protein
VCSDHTCQADKAMCGSGVGYHVQQMNDAEKIYAELWSKTIPLFEQGHYETDPLVHDPTDMRRGLTLRARLTKEVVAIIDDFTTNVKGFLPNQYFTPPSDIHLTVLAVVSCTSDFRHQPEMDDAYCDVIAECLRSSSSPQIIFSGITASPSCLLLRGFPMNSCLGEMRNRLREKFKQSLLPNSVDARYPIKTAHVTMMRFVEKQDDISGFTRFIKAHHDHPFGSQHVDSLEFVSNDWCHKQCNTKIIRTFALNT